MRRVRAGESFEVLARELAHVKWLRMVGGDQGYLPVYEFPQLVDRVAGMKEGEVSDVIALDGGFQILQFLGRRDAVIVPYEDLKVRLRTQLMAEGREKRERPSPANTAQRWASRSSRTNMPGPGRPPVHRRRSNEPMVYAQSGGYQAMLRKSVIVLAVILLAGTGIAGADSGVAGGTTGVEARINSFWDALVARDWYTTYWMEKGAQEDPPRDALTYFDDMAKTARIAVYAIEGVQLEGNRATATISTEMVLILGGQGFAVPRLFSDHWVMVNGSWYHDTFYDDAEEPNAMAGQSAALQGEAIQPPDILQGMPGQPVGGQEASPAPPGSRDATSGTTGD